MPLLAVATVWAILTFATYASLILIPFNDWSTGDKLSLLESCIGIAGFGAGTAALVFAGAQIAERMGKPEIKMADLGVVELFMQQNGEARANVLLAVENSGNITPTSWRMAVYVPKPLIIEDVMAHHGEARLDGNVLTIDGRQPLVGRTDIGNLRIKVTQHNVPMDMSMGVAWFEGFGPLRVQIDTDYGRTTFDFPVAIGSPGAEQMRRSTG